jgi:uncharacterized protein
MTDTLRPVAPEERIHALDMLRGWAMFGVLWSNLNDWYGTREPASTLDHALSWTQDWLLESRFYSLLILLFGIGFGIQLTRAGERGTDLRTTYYRRSAALLAIGVIHGTLIWNGDILTNYALVAFALVMFRTTSTRGLVVAAALLWFLGPTIVQEVRFLAGLRIPVRAPTGEWTAVYAHGSWRYIQAVRVKGYLNGLGYFGLTRYVTILASFLMGLWAVKSGFLRRALEEPRMTRRVLTLAAVLAAVGYASWIWGNAVWPRIQPPPDAPLQFPYPWFQRIMLRQFVFRIFDWTTEGSALVYASLLLLLWQRPVGQRLLRPLAATGRMALTTYLTQSVVCTLLFYGYGLGWYGSVGFTGMLLITLVLFGGQMAASTWWLRRFRYGPVEWLWRALTYGRAPAMGLAT